MAESSTQSHLSSKATAFSIASLMASDESGTFTFRAVFRVLTFKSNDLIRFERIAYTNSLEKLTKVVMLQAHDHK